MITKWATSSVFIIILRIRIISHLYHLTIVCWIVLEMLTWSFFFLFFISYNKVLINHLFLFFVIQTSCRFIWLLRTIVLKVEVRGNILMYLRVGLSLLVKIGLFPGHVWRLYLYNTASMPVILVLSSIAKATPLIMLMMWSAEYADEGIWVVAFYWVIISYIVVIVNIRVRRNLFSFIFYSSIFHIANIILILMLNFLIFFFVYFLTYVFILLSFTAIYYFYKFDKFQRSYRTLKNDVLVLHLIGVTGFPPFPLFWYKLLVLYKLWRGDLFVSISSLVVVIIMFVYLLTLVSSIVKGWGCSKNYYITLSGGCEAKLGMVAWKSLSPHFLVLLLPIITMFALL